MRNVLASLYNGICNIIEYQSVKDPITKRTINKENIVLEKQACRLSYKTVTKSTDGNVSEIIQITKLFLDPSVSVKPGSKIIVTQNGITKEYKNSGEPAIYSNHQEIVLDLFDRWT